MAEGNSYYADPNQLQAGIRQIDQISNLASEIVNEFVRTVNLTSDWPGHDDSYARVVIPQDKKERLAATDTGTAVDDAVFSVVDGTKANLDNVINTQNGVLDAINESSSGNSGRRH
jgi:hypothetical protein